MINRAAVVLRCKDPFLKWVNEADPVNDNPGLTLAEVNEESTVYLITEEDGDNVNQWLANNYNTLFENELESWYADTTLWPKKRGRKTFDKWFDVECHTVIIDTVGSLIVDDEE